MAGFFIGRHTGSYRFRGGDLADLFEGVVPSLPENPEPRLEPSWPPETVTILEGLDRRKTIAASSGGFEI